MKLLELEDGTICIKIGKQNQVQVIKRTSSSIDISRIENHFKVSLVLKEKFKMYVQLITNKYLIIHCSVS